MNVALWIAAGVLATVLLISTSKAFVPREKIAAVGGPAAQWVEDFSPSALRAIATLEFLAAAGLILPAALDIAPVMVPVTAICWILLMVGAMVTHGRLGQPKLVMVTLVYLLLAAFKEADSKAQAVSDERMAPFASMMDMGGLF